MKLKDIVFENDFLYYGGSTSDKHQKEELIPVFNNEYGDTEERISSHSKYFSNILNGTKIDINYKKQIEEEKAIEQILSINKYIENPFEKLNEYEGKIHEKLKNSNKFAVCLEKNTLLLDLWKSEPEKLKQNYDLIFYQLNEILSDILFFSSLLKIKEQSESDSDKKLYLNISRGYAFAIILEYLDTGHAPEVGFRYGTNTWNYLNYAQNTLLKIFKDSTLDTIDVFVAEFSTKYPLFRYIEPLFLYDEQAVFTPKAINYARSLGKELFALVTSKVFIHNGYHSSVEMINHDYAHYDDTIGSLIESDTTFRILAVVDNIKKIYTFFYNFIESDKSPFERLEDQQLAHHIFMFVLRDFYPNSSYNKKETSELFFVPQKYNKWLQSFSSFLIKMMTHVLDVAQSRDFVMHDFLDSASDIIKFFKILKNDIIINKPSNLDDKYQILGINYKFDGFKTFGCYKALVDWFVNKCQDTDSNLEPHQWPFEEYSDDHINTKNDSDSQLSGEDDNNSVNDLDGLYYS